MIPTKSRNVRMALTLVGIILMAIAASFNPSAAIVAGIGSLFIAENTPW